MSEQIFITKQLSYFSQDTNPYISQVKNSLYKIQQKVHNLNQYELFFFKVFSLELFL